MFTLADNIRKNIGKGRPGAKHQRSQVKFTDQLHQKDRKIFPEIDRHKRQNIP